MIEIVEFFKGKIGYFMDIIIWMNIMNIIIIIKKNL